MLSVFGAVYGHTWVLAALQLVPQQARAATGSPPARTLLLIIVLICALPMQASDALHAWDLFDIRSTLCHR